MRTVAVYADPDASALHVREADVAVRLPGTTPTETYLRREAVVEAARHAGADAVHPGYGFLAEDPVFASLCAEAGLVFVGPPPDAISAMALKIRAKELASEAGVPLLPGAEVDGEDPQAWVRAADGVGYPLLVKASAGGGGRGMRRVDGPDSLPDAVAAARREAESAFGDGTVFLERLLDPVRHVEIQVVADKHGNVIHLGERECSVQRRHQKVIEEAPSPVVTPELRKAMGSAACSLGAAIGYTGVGTVEFLLDATDDESFYFLEMNTRLQVEHPVTESITGLDLVRLQLEIAMGNELELSQEDLRLDGHAIEARIYAEDPSQGWLPSPGRVERWQRGATSPIRWDTGVVTGSDVPAAFDPLLAKAISHAPRRHEAATRLARALRELNVHGITTNVGQLVAVLEDHRFLSAQQTTGLLEDGSLTGTPDAATIRQAAAAAALHSALVRHAGSAYRFAPVGWRNVRSAPGTVAYATELGEASVAYVFDRDGNPSVTVDGAPLEVRLLEYNETRIILAFGGLTTVHDLATYGDVVFVNSPTGQVRLQEVPRFVGHGAGAAAAGPSAPVPGQVVSVLVRSGDRVQAGDTLVVMEAMKMEHRIVAPEDAIVAEVLVAEGDAVDAHQVLVHFEEAE